MCMSAETFRHFPEQGGISYGVNGRRTAKETDRGERVTAVGDAVVHHPAFAAELSRLFCVIHDIGQDGPEEREQNYFLIL